MINFIEISEKKLKFIFYPHLRAIGYLALLAICLPWLIWSLSLSPIESSLICHKNTFNFVDCQLTESSLLDRDLNTIKIKNLRKANRPFFRKGSQIALQASPNILLSNHSIIYRKQSLNNKS